MEIAPPVRIAAVALLVLSLIGLGWQGYVIYQADQRAQQAATLALEGPGGPAAGGGGTGSQTAGRGTEAGDAGGAAHGGTGGESGTPPPGRAEADPPAPAPRRLIVHVAGAVQKPGVYTFEEGARVNDAIVAAGGALAEGVPDALNLAAPLGDGAKVYVYTKAELQPAAQAPAAARGATYAPVAAAEPPTPPTAAPQTQTQQGPVNVNTATAAELERVPGIGPATARAILEHRAKHGAFKRIEDLTAVSGIGPKTLEKLRPYLQV